MKLWVFIPELTQLQSRYGSVIWSVFKKKKKLLEFNSSLVLFYFDVKSIYL